MGAAAQLLYQASWLSVFVTLGKITCFFFKFFLVYLFVQKFRAIIVLRDLKTAVYYDFHVTQNTEQLSVIDPSGVR